MSKVMHAVSQWCPSEEMCLALSLSPGRHEVMVLSQLVSFGVALPRERAFKALEEWAGNTDI